MKLFYSLKRAYMFRLTFEPGTPMSSLLSSVIADLVMRKLEVGALFFDSVSVALLLEVY